MRSLAECRRVSLSFASHTQRAATRYENRHASSAYPRQRYVCILDIIKMSKKDDSFFNFVRARGMCNTQIWWFCSGFYSISDGRMDGLPLTFCKCFTVRLCDAVRPIFWDQADFPRWKFLFLNTFFKNLGTQKGHFPHVIAYFSARERRRVLLSFTSNTQRATVRY